MAKAVDAAKAYMKEYYKSAIKLNQNEYMNRIRMTTTVGNSIMNVNLQQFTRTWPSATVGMAEGGDEEVEEEDELGGKSLLILLL